ncbi:uncharacterized protein LOC111400503 [Olea europaea var. sylvestris]|uniref:uncharacterized protein LOC111400503 n=1 Tax=Olea europaea var. sylvestris TaxID=158386 RepID=UPI000C1D18E9|nr:uncharacterized protein LOC111400503 [Olea europaea var. sylvestris]
MSSRCLVSEGKCRATPSIVQPAGQMTGHIAKDCPTFAQKKDDNNDYNKKGKSRVFTMTQKDAEENSNVIAGTLLIYDTPAYVLFDARVTHFFISTSFIAKSSINCDKSKSTLEVSIPSGRTLNTNQFARSVNLKIEGKTFEANLYVIKMKDFDMILGMDCIGLKAEKMSRKEISQGFPVNISGEKLATIKIEDVLVVQEFIDLFPEDLPGIPLDRPVEFTVDLVPEVALVSKTPYIMVPKELQELKIQLQELLDNWLYSTKCIVMGRTDIVCKEERWKYADGYRLSGVEPFDCQD